MEFDDPLLSERPLANRYLMQRRLGKGNMGRVYLGYDLTMERAPRAIKQMNVAFVDQEQYAKAIADFHREAQILSDLDHPAIPKIVDFFLEAGNFYLVMEFINGKNLSDLLGEMPDRCFPEPTVVKWGIQLLAVLEYIHNLKPPMIYRDMKPANVIYEEDRDRVVIIDFGIARLIEVSGQQVTAVGTLGYAPPELFHGKATRASDIYALGATLYQLITGSAPKVNYQGPFNFSRNPRPRQVNEAITEKMEDILMKAVEEKPEDRFVNATVMMQALIDHLRSLDPRLFDLPPRTS